jgi:hypothetical protein
VGGGVTPPIIQTLVKVGQNGTDICLKFKVKLGKIWDKRWSKLPKVMKWFAISTIFKLLLRLRLKNRKFCSSWSKNFEFAYVGPEKLF